MLNFKKCQYNKVIDSAKINIDMLSLIYNKREKLPKIQTNKELKIDLINITD